MSVYSVSVYLGSVTIRKGEWYYGAYATVRASSYCSMDVTWYSDNTAVAAVNAATGYIYGRSAGTAIITATAQDGSRKYAECRVTVNSPIAVTDIEVCPTSLTMNVGDAKYLCTTITPYNATNQSVTWCSSNENVATVGIHSGRITAKRAGTATITATTADGGYQANCTLTVIIDTVTIKKDGAFNKVVFNKTGKVWRCINRDMIFDEENMNNTFLIQRSNHNFFTYYNENDPLMSNTTPKEYTDYEIKLLYAIDPHGVAYYIQRYVAELEISLENKVKYKDRIFRMLFDREPKYFARTIDGVWYEVNGYEEINDVLSESEIYFGMHPIYDWHTFFEILGVCSSILNVVFLTNFFTSTVAGVIIKRVVTTGLLVASGIESVLRNEFADYTPGDAFEAAIENTLPDWAAAYVSLYESIDDLADAMTLNLNYNKEIIDYCACHTGYNVLFEMKNGSTYKLKDVCDMMGE